MRGLSTAVGAPRSSPTRRIEKMEAVETIHAEIHELEGSIAQLMEQITELTKAVAELGAR